jgi:hypothetical protein
LIDALAFVLMLMLLSTGLVLAHQLPPGSGSLHGRGTGAGTMQRPVELLWGWTRHQWGDVHYWIAYALLAVLAFHLLLHWKWIVCVVQGKPSNASPYRLALGGVGLVFLALMTALPLATGTRQLTRGELAIEGPAARGEGLAVRPDAVPLIRGSMTLDEIAQALDVSLATIIERLNLPSNTAGSERAGRLMRSRGLEMNDLRRALGLAEDE